MSQEELRLATQALAGGLAATNLAAAAGPQPDKTSFDQCRSLSPKVKHSGTAHGLTHDSNRVKYPRHTYTTEKIYLQGLRCLIIETVDLFRLEIPARFSHKSWEIQVMPHSLI